MQFNRCTMLMKPAFKDCKGFTLIEIAISMMILGVIMASALSAYGIYKQKQEIMRTSEVVQTVNQSLQSFKSNFGRYPCPAPILEPRNSANYGREVACDGVVEVVASDPPSDLPDLPPLNTNPADSPWNCTVNYIIGATWIPFQLIYDPNGPYCRLKNSATTNYPLYTKYLRYARAGGQISGDASSFRNFDLNICLTYGSNELTCKRNKLQTQVNNYNSTLNESYDYSDDLMTVNAVAPLSGSTPFPYTIASEYQANYDRLLSLISLSSSSDVTYTLSEFNTGNFDCFISNQVRCNIARITQKIDAYNANIQTLINGQPGPGSDPATTLLPGQCLSGGTPASPTVSGVCVEQSARTDLDNRNVRVGAIPFRDMQLDEKDTLDGYGNRLVYAVTQDMAKVDTFKENGGGIHIIDSNNADLSVGGQSAAYVVFSTGKNGNGAVNADAIARPCNDNQGDSENCRNYAFGSAVPGANTAATYRMDVGSNNFDDVMAYFIPTETPVWRRTTQTAETVKDITTGNIGVGISNPADITDRLTIAQSSVQYTNNSAQYANLALVNGDPAYQTGSLRVGLGGNGASDKIFAPQYCNEDMTRCFKVENIMSTFDSVGTGNGMGGCAAGEFMVGIKEGKAICKPVRFSCSGANQVLIGFNADGTPNCTTINTSCPATTKTLCGQSEILPLSGHGGTAPLSQNCAQATYECNNGAWQLKSGAPFIDNQSACNTSLQSLMSAVYTVQTSCSEALGNGFGGFYQQKFYNGCEGQPQTLPGSDVSTCVCQGTYSEETHQCAENFTVTGNQVLHRINHAVCVNGQISSTIQSGPWMIGGIVATVNNVKTIVGGVPLLDSNPDEACSCNNLGDKIDFKECSDGGVRKSNPTPAAFTLAPYNWPSDPKMGKYRTLQFNQNQCKYNPPSGNSYDDSNCVLFRNFNPQCESCHTPSTAKVVKYTRQGNQWVQASVENPGSCMASTYAWHQTGTTQIGPSQYGKGGKPAVDGPCGCSDNLSPNICWVQRADSKYDFFNCTCQQTNLINFQ